MNFLANADAIIIDIRDTPGGYPNMVQLLCSYFVRGTQEGRTHLNSFERRFDHSIEQFWTQAYVPGPRMYDTDLYVLTSQYTGSGAEELAYNLRNLERAILVGENTAGAAHPVKDVVIQNDFIMHLPDGRPINPISGTNWEGTGVEPHVSVRADQAFDTAYLMVLEKNLAEVGDENRRFQITWAIDGLRAKLKPVEVDEAVLRNYAGTYGERKVWLENGQLFYRRSGPAFRLIALKEHVFALDGLDRFRIEFVLDQNGQTKELVGHYDNGMMDSSVRTE
jgi:C-terminal processing protease CtpA/Prc